MSGCYFSVDFQGEFVTQVASSLGDPDTNLAGDQIQYSTVHIQPDGIPIWGKCHKKIGNNVILVERSVIFYIIMCLSTILTFERDCTVPPYSLPNLVQLEVGACIKSWRSHDPEFNANKVIHFNFNKDIK